MMRYFFDVNDKSSTQYDYSGRFFPNIGEAREMAELIAIDLACTEIDQSFAREVQVRDPAGKQLFSVAVRLRDALAA